MRVYEFREFSKDFHYLVRTLSAGSHHNYVSGSLLGYSVLEHGLAASERTRDEARTAFGYRVESVDDAHARFHNLLRTRFLAVALHGHLDRPFLHHSYIVLSAFGIDQHRNCLVYVVLSCSCYGLNRVLAVEAERNHDFVRQPAFLDFSEPACGLNLVAGSGQRGEVPKLAMVQRVGVFASFEEYAGHCGEVVLESVIDARQKSRTE